MRRLADFEGLWRLSRVITHADGQVFEFRGTALFCRDGERLVSEETGEMHGPGGDVVRAGRRYLWHAGLRVTFEDGRDFHTVPPGGGETSHRCDPDDYIVTYDFEEWPVWRTVWRVTGPRKDYVMESVYAPQTLARRDADGIIPGERFHVRRIS